MDQSTLKALTEFLSLSQLLQAMGVLLVGWLAIKLLWWVVNRLAGRFRRYRLYITGVFPFLRLLIWVFVIGVILLGVLNPPREIMLAVLASAGIAVGLAAQDVVRGIIAGMLIMFNGSLRVGDMVKIGEHYGEVVSMNLNVVCLRTFDDNLVSIPNAVILNQAVSDANAGELIEMVVIGFNLPATADVQRVKRLAWKAAVGSPYTYLKKPVFVLAEDRFERTFLTRFQVKAYVLDIRFERLLASDIIERIKKALVAEGLLNEAMVLGLFDESARHSSVRLEKTPSPLP